MNLEGIIGRFFLTYGRTFTIGDLVGKCVLSSKGGQNSQFLEENIQRVGSKIQGKYIMFCLPNTAIYADDIVTIGGILYQADGIDDYYIGEIAIYKWVILSRIGGENG